VINAAIRVPVESLIDRANDENLALDQSSPTGSRRSS
jgi:hypothetical protein